MPDWARPQDVVFDEAAANAAIEAVAALRFVLAWSWESEHLAAQAALGGWHGRSAERFASALAGRGRRLTDNQRDLGHLQRSLEVAVVDAQAEQRRIDLAQAAWDRTWVEEQPAVATGSDG